MTKRTTLIGSQIEYLPDDTRRITNIGLDIEHSREPSPKRTTLLGAQLEYAGTNNKKRITLIGVMVEYRLASNLRFGPRLQEMSG